VGLLLLLLAFQVVVSIRRDRLVAQVDEAEEADTAGQPAYLEDLEFRERNLPPDAPRAEQPVQEPVRQPVKKVGPPPGKATPSVPPNLTKRSRNQKKKR
jgi:hypothetical protein